MSNISNINTHELVLSKENIQPLRKGRDTSILCTALQAETDADAHQELEKQRNEFEIKLRSNTSEDPLSAWCEYIHWIEQSFPKQPREGKLNVVLQKCINKFKDCEQYMNDVRFVKLCIKYADIGENTVELLSQIHRHGIGVSCAEFYIAWAEKYAVDNCFKKANAIYERGIQCGAQPLQLLQEAHQNFQAFLVRKMLNEKEIFQPSQPVCNSSEVRQAYNVLQPVTSGQKELAPIIRVGSNVIGGAGKLQQNNKEQRVKNNVAIKIFEDSESNLCAAEPKMKIEKVHSKKAITKENTVKPGKWTNKGGGHVPFAVDSATSLPFKVHRDEVNEESEKKPQNVPSSVLKSHKVKTDYEDDNFANAPLFYPEPYDPTKLPMYCKEQVYAGGLEFQFEELHAIQYRKKREELKREQSRALAFASPEVNLVDEQSPLRPAVSTHSKSSYEKLQVKSNDSVDKKRLHNESRRRTLFSNSVSVKESNKNNYVPEENLPNTEYSLNQTIHTKEALSEMQQLWFSKPASPVPTINKPTKNIGKSILKSSKPCFSLYVDESCLGNLKVSEEPEKPLDLTLKSGNISNSEDPKTPEKRETDKAQHFSCKIFVDEDLNQVNTRGTELPNTGILAKNWKENIFIQEDLCAKTSEFEIDDEDKENGIPEGYCGPIGKSNRKVSGILTPAENIEVAPLSDEEVEDDEEEQDFFNSIQCNNTGITETWNFTKGFQFPRGESTPNVRKSIHNKEDFNSSVFVPEPSNDEFGVQINEREPKLEGNSENLFPLNPSDKKMSPRKADNFTKNLSVIAETSREYKSSSSGSSGASTLAIRSSKNFPYTPSETRSAKYSLTSQTLQKIKVQSYSGYEGSSEYSQTALKTSTSTCENFVLRTTSDLLEKLNAIETISINANDKKEVHNTHGKALQKRVLTEVEYVQEDLNKTQTEEKENIDSVKESIDPFNNELIDQFLQRVDFPKTNHANGYFLLHDIDLPAPKAGSTVTLGAHTYDVKKLIGEGSYAKIYKLLNTRNGEHMIAKFQKPAFPWEFYITREVQLRIKDKDFACFFMDVEAAYFFKNSSVLLTHPVEFGDLLTAINKMKQGKMMCQILAMYFTCQILNILEHLHSCKIIHADLKPDNFLLRSHNKKLTLQLIDFGRSIDMSLFPEGTTFTKVVTTEGFTTVEMQTGKPWTYQIDLYGAANCGHCLLFGDYMKVTEKNGVWNITKTMPRYWARTEWKNFFVTLLNVESCSKLPDLSELRESFEAILAESSEFEFSLIKLNNLLNNR